MGIDELFKLLPSFGAAGAVIAAVWIFVRHLSERNKQNNAFIEKITDRFSGALAEQRLDIQEARENFTENLREIRKDSRDARESMQETILRLQVRHDEEIRLAENRVLAVGERGRESIERALQSQREMNEAIRNLETMIERAIDSQKSLESAVSAMRQQLTVLVVNPTRTRSIEAPRESDGS